jgi:excinuclease UvrABC ATPase subunit
VLPGGWVLVGEEAKLVRVSPQRLVADPARSLMEGAVEGGKAVRDAALRQGLPVDRAWRDLSWEEQDFVLRGGPGWEGAVRRATRLAAGDRATERISLATREDRCAACEGTGLGPFAAHVTAGGTTLPKLLGSPIATIQQVFQPSGMFGSAASAAAAPLIDEIRRRLDFLVRVGLGHLCLAREARTLSTGEIQRVRIAAQRVGGVEINLGLVAAQPVIGRTRRFEGSVVGSKDRRR